MADISRLFQAFVAPAIFVSAEGLLLLSLNVRLMGMVSRLRAYLHNKHLAAKEGRIEESEAYASQIASIEHRAEMIRRAFLFTVYSLLGTIATCLLLGLGLYWQLRAGDGGSSFRGFDELFAGWDGLLCSRSERGPKFGAPGGGRFAIHGLVSNAA